VALIVLVIAMWLFTRWRQRQNHPVAGVPPC